MENIENEAVVRIGNTAPKIVRVKIPAKAAYNFDALVKINKAVLGRLGCENCHSGFDIRHEFEQEFLVDANLNVRAPEELFR
ncbi:hypothetical protein [Thiothrix nivea]|uniref:Uncharacterized protein n=1 Tax=Thiothrix nivea (strain ATCC 35100 / DSM 5205 / JP2) TaxID=870187 RepID=A0A656HKC2_THINJ|nr:hypothetical protein [Thiothrix nivea]EIJ36927.1 hypothetical protein Thini_4449 [Thiothrix nivea DSM 5205]